LINFMTGFNPPARTHRQREALDALANRWERRLAENSGATRDALECGKKLQLRECLDELLAEMEGAPA
jgi:hypothetical protein